MTEKITELENLEPAYFKGEELKLSYSIWSLIQLEEKQGVRMDDLQDDAGKSKFDFVQLMKLVWAGLIDKYPEVTFEEVAKSFSLGDMQSVSKELERAMNASTAMGKRGVSAGLISQ